MSSTSPALPGTRLPGGRQALGMALYLALHLGLAWISFVYPARGLNITPWNPNTALAVGFLLWQPRAWWLVGIAIASSEALVGSEQLPWPALALSACALTAGYAATATCLKRWVGPSLSVIGRRDVAIFLLVTAGGTLLGSALRALALWGAGELPMDRIAPAIHRGWIGDGVGLVVTLPVLLVLASAERTAATRTMLRARESWVIALLTVLAVVVVFTRPAEDQFKLFYLLFLPVVWAAARFGAIGAVWSAALVQLLLMAAVQASRYQPLTVFEFQLLLAALTATGILFGATVDEREQAQQALRASLRLAAAGDMAAALAHELNQPLTAISTYARASQLMAQRLEGSDPASVRPLVDVTDKLAEEATRAGEVVNRLRKFFRERTTELQPAALADLIGAAVRAQTERAAALGVRLEWSCDPDLGPLWLDPVQIAVVLRNLLANGIEAASGPEQRPGAPSLVAVRALHDGAEVHVAVVDSGPGLALQDVQRVFDKRHSEKPGGMGVGLAISRSIVEAHGGRLWAEPGPGGQFHFTLPAHAAVLHG